MYRKLSDNPLPVNRVITVASPNRRKYRPAMFRGDRLRKLIARHNMTVTAVAEALGVRQGRVSDWQRGAHGPGPQRVQQLADLFGVSVAYLRGVENEEDSPEKKGGAAPTESIALTSFGLKRIPLLSWSEAASMQHLAENLVNWRGDRVYVADAPDNVVAVRAQGTSANLWFRKDDVLVVDLDSRELEDGRFYVFRADGVLSLKQYDADHRRLVPRSDDPTQTPTYLDNSKVEIVGRVIKQISDV